MVKVDGVKRQKKGIQKEGKILMKVTFLKIKNMVMVNTFGQINELISDIGIKVNSMV